MAKAAQRTRRTPEPPKARLSLGRSLHRLSVRAGSRGVARSPQRESCETSLVGTTSSLEPRVCKHCRSPEARLEQASLFPLRCDVCGSFRSSGPTFPASDVLPRRLNAYSARAESCARCAGNNHKCRQEGSETPSLTPRAMFGLSDVWTKVSGVDTLHMRHLLALDALHSRC